MSSRFRYGGSETALSGGNLSLNAGSIMNSGTPAAACLLWGYQKSGTVKEGELIRGQAQGTRKFDWYPLFRSTNLCYGPARSGEGTYCVSALKDKEPAEKNQG
jgi:hypothetical protein